MIQLSRTLARIAGDLERRGYPYHGAVRQAAQALLDLPDDRDDGRTCRGCGDPFTPNVRGRPRIYCRTCSPPKKTEKG